MPSTIIDRENKEKPTLDVFRPKTPFGTDLLDFICAMRSLGFDDNRIGQALLVGAEKGLPGA